jgi:hypothetical protein
MPLRFPVLSLKSLIIIAAICAPWFQALSADAPTFASTTCEGTYPKHLQGVAADGRQAIFWSWTDALVKTDLQGRLLRRIPADDHHGDLCFAAGKVYVAVNLGKFNAPPGAANSWVTTRRSWNC